jgi:hypothetical protein
MTVENKVPLRNLKKLISFFISLSLIAISEAPAFADFNGYYKLQTKFLGNKTCLEGNRLAEDSTLGGAAFMDDCKSASGQSWKLVKIN